MDASGFHPRKNCILADEMGLGKTIQSITFLYEIFSMGIRGPFLIIAPLSTITNWEREFRTWTHMNVIVYHGSQISRQMILQYEMFHRDPQVMFDCSHLLSLISQELNQLCYVSLLALKCKVCSNIWCLIPVEIPERLGFWGLLQWYKMSLFALQSLN